MDNVTQKQNETSHSALSGDFSKVLIIVPAYNEENNILRTIQEIKAVNPTFKIAVINDASSDQTQSQAEKASAAVLTLPFNLGIGGAVQTGFRFAFEHDFDYAVKIDGDGQHDPKYLRSILEPVMKGEVDMCIGSRFLPPFLGDQSSFTRRLGINFFAVLISFLSGIKVTDPTSGFRAFNHKLIRVFAEYYPQDYPEPEAIVVAKRYGAKIQEVSVQMRKRQGGKSSIRKLRSIYYMIKVTVAVMINQLKKKKELKGER